VNQAGVWRARFLVAVLASVCIFPCVLVAGMMKYDAEAFKDAKKMSKKLANENAKNLKKHGVKKVLIVECYGEFLTKEEKADAYNDFAWDGGTTYTSEIQLGSDYYETVANMVYEMVKTMFEKNGNEVAKRGAGRRAVQGARIGIGPEMALEAQGEIFDIIALAARAEHVDRKPARIQRAGIRTVVLRTVTERLGSVLDSRNAREPLSSIPRAVHGVAVVYVINRYIGRRKPGAVEIHLLKALGNCHYRERVGNRKVVVENNNLDCDF
jgi:hypothetical protein